LDHTYRENGIKSFKSGLNFTGLGSLDARFGIRHMNPPLP